jgi:hypothetical protein
MELLRDKVQIIKDWPRRYVKGYARITTPLTNLLKEVDPAKRQQKYRPVGWTFQCQRAFNKLVSGVVMRA